MKTWRVVILAAALAVVSASASAQTICGKRQAFLDQLAKSHQEVPSAVGLLGNGSVIEVLTSEKGSWTMIVTDPNGVSCLLAGGEAWESVARVAVGPDA